jgi:uncharacterized protein YcsI (UPF0317 family)
MHDYSQQNNHPHPVTCTQIKHDHSHPMMCTQSCMMNTESQLGNTVISLRDICTYHLSLIHSLRARLANCHASRLRRILMSFQGASSTSHFSPSVHLTHAYRAIPVTWLCKPTYDSTPVSPRTYSFTTRAMKLQLCAWRQHLRDVDTSIQSNAP